MRCSYSAGTYVLLTPNEDFPAGTYFIKVTTLDQTTNGVVFPTAISRNLLTVTTNDGGDLVTDIGLLTLPATPFSTFKIDNWNSIQASQGYYIITLSVGTAVAIDQASAEHHLVLEFDTNDYNIDLGASSTTFDAEGIAYHNGMVFPLKVDTLTDAQASLLYGDTTTTPRSPAKLIIGSHSVAYPANTALTFKLPYIKNPATGDTMSIKASIVQYAASTAYPTVLYSNTYYSWSLPVVAAPSSPGTAQNLAITNFYPQTDVSVNFQSLRFTANIDASKKVFIKFKDDAKGWDYDAITTLSCTGYAVDYFKDFYLMILTPSGSKGTTISITCATFRTAGQVIYPTTFEVGRYEVGNANLNTYTITRSMTANPTAQSVTGLVQERAVDDYDNPNSVNLITLTYTPTETFIIPAGGRIVVTYATLNSFKFPGPGRTECTVVGLQDLGGTEDVPKAVTCAHDSANNRVEITGYAAFTSPSGTIIIKMFLRVGSVVVPSINFKLFFYDSNNELFGQTGNFAPDLTRRVNQDFDGLEEYTAPDYRNYPLPVYSGSTAPLRLQFRLATALTSATGVLSVKLPPNYEYRSAVASERKAYYSTDDGVSYVSTSFTVTGAVATGYTVEVVPFVGFDMPASTDIILYLTTEGVDDGDGMVYPDAGLNFFTAEVKISGTVVEAAYHEYALPPAEDNDVAFSIYSYNRNEPTIVETTFTKNDADTTYVVADGDELELMFRTNDELDNLWPTELGLTIFDGRAIVGCAEVGGASTITATDPVKCLALPAASASPDNYARVRARITRTIANGEQIKFFVAQITMSASNNAKIPVKARIVKPCRFYLRCPVFQSESSYITSRNYANLGQANLAAPTMSNDEVQATNVQYTFKPTLTNNINGNGIITIEPDTAHYKIANDCTSSTGICASIPSIGLILYQPSGGANGAYEFDVTMDNPQWENDDNPTFKMEMTTYQNGRWQQYFEVAEPNYGKIQLNTVTDRAVRTDIPSGAYPEYYLLHFDNVFEFSVEGFYAQEGIQRLEYLIDNRYSDLSDDYCGAYLEISATQWRRLDCKRLSNVEIEVFLEYDPWLSAYAGYKLKVFGKGYHPITGYSGGMSLTGRALYSMTKNYRSHESRTTVTILDDPLTPIITEVVFQDLVFTERTARIGDQIDFLLRMEPFQPQQRQFQQFKFVIDDAFAYPAVTALVCRVKRYSDELRSCTLERIKGETVVTIDVYDEDPNDYQYGHESAKIVIQNPDQIETFVAPSVEGLYDFTGRYVNDSDYLLERDTTGVEVVGCK